MLVGQWKNTAPKGLFGTTHVELLPAFTCCFAPLLAIYGTVPLDTYLFPSTTNAKARGQAEDRTKDT